MVNRNEKTRQAPDGLSREARGLWVSAARMLHARGLFDPRRRMLLAEYCGLYDRYLTLQESIGREGLVIITKTGRHRANPAADVQAKVLTRMARLGNDLLLTPAGRAKHAAKVAAEERRRQREKARRTRRAGRRGVGPGRRTGGGRAGKAR